VEVEAMTDAERSLLLALFRWAWGQGVLNVGWAKNPIWRRVHTGPTVALDRRHAADSIQVQRPGDPRGTRLDDYPVRTVAEAVDILAALNVIPARFSTAYRAGWDTGREDMEHHGPAGEAFRAIIPAAYLS
jgi:hypothetical protein